MYNIILNLYNRSRLFPDKVKPIKKLYNKRKAYAFPLLFELFFLAVMRINVRQFSVSAS